MNIPTVKQRIEAILAKYLPSEQVEPCHLHAAMRYCVLNGGKRLRAQLVYAAGLAFNAPDDLLDRLATAIEMIHAYSLIHDDLPCMDDDDLRRGKPTCHIQFDEATAVLAGDALQSLAFGLLSCGDADAQTQLTLVNELANAIGPQGMAGGQTLDLLATGKSLTQEQVEKIHHLKTGKLITASIYLGAFCGSASSAELIALKSFGDTLGLAFQIQDDILDVEQSTEILGKTAGKDVSQNKATYPSVVGLEQAKKDIETLYLSALEDLKALSVNTDELTNLANLMVNRGQ